MSPSGRWQPWVVRGFEAAFRPWMHRRLGGIHMAGLEQVPTDGRPLIFAANHVSWWDGFLVREVHRRLRPQGPLFTLMGSEQLGRNGFLRRLGVLAVESGRPAALKALLRRLDEQRARHPELAVSMFPQGRIATAGRRPLGLRPGIVHVARRLAPAWVVPVALRFEPLTTPGPHAFVTVGRPLAAGSLELLELESTLSERLDAVERLLSLHGEEVLAHWPPQDATVEGRAAARIGGAA